MKLHLPAPHEDDAGIGRTLCGRHAALLVGPEHATCLRCTKLHSSGTRREYVRPIGWDEALRDVLAVIAGPRVEPYPAITPDVYRAMRCREGQALTPAAYDLAAVDGGEPVSRHRICRCDFCTIDERDQRNHDEWHQSQQIRPHRRHEHPFGSYRAALSMLLHWTRSGATVRSHSGSVQSRAEEALKLGAHVQTTLRTDRESLEIRRATDAVDIGRAVCRAFAQDEERRGLSVSECTAIVLSTVDTDGPSPEDWAEATGLTIRSVRALIRHARRQIQIDLAASRTIPYPRDQRLWSEIEARRAPRELAMRRSA